MGKSPLFTQAQVGGMFGVVDQRYTTGNIWFVDSSSSGASDSAGAGQNPDVPFATLDYAVGKCTANAGDVILVMPGHTENLAADSAVDIDVEGVHVVGIRNGRQMPTFTATAAAGDIKLAAAGVTIENLRVLGGIDATTGVIEVSAADCVIKDCEYRDSTGEATDTIMVTANADRLLIDGWIHFGAAGDGGDTAIALNAADDVEIKNFRIYGNFDLGAIQCRTAASARLFVHDGMIWTEGAEDLAVKDLITGSTGVIGPNLYIALQDDAANITEAITGAGFMVMDPVYVVNAAGEKALSLNWTASTDT